MDRRGTLTRKLAVGSFLVVALGFVILLLKRQWTSLDDVLAGLRGFEWQLIPGWVVAALVIAVADLLLMGSVWAGLFRRTGGTAPRWEGIRVWVLTSLGRYIPGKVWQLGGLTAYMKVRGESGAAALVSALAFQVVVLVTGGAVAVTTVGVHWAGGVEAVPAGVILGALLAVGLHPSVLRLAARRLSGLLGESQVAVDLNGTDIAVATLGMLVAWALSGVGFACLLQGIGVAWPVRDVDLLTGIFAASYVIGYVALVAPGGLVVREGAMTGLLAGLGGMSVGVAAMTAIAARLWLVAAELLALGIAVAIPGPGRPEEV